MEFLMAKHFGNRRKGFYFWTTKKNFLSLYIACQNPGVADLRDIFRCVLEKTERALEGKEKCRQEWNIYSRYLSHRYLRTTGDHIEWIRPRIDPSHVLGFLYDYKYNIEEFIVCVIDDWRGVDMSLLLKGAMRVFSTVSTQVDEEMSHSGRIYTREYYSPISSVGFNSVFDWNEYYHGRSKT